MTEIRSFGTKRIDEKSPVAKMRIAYRVNFITLVFFLILASVCRLRDDRIQL